jgi:hypothetical protein
MPKHRGKLGNPLCYKCNGFTACVSGSGREKKTKRYLYRYTCLDADCGETKSDGTFIHTKFSRVPDSELYVGEEPEIYPYEPRKIKYKCNVCGLPKKGHICKGSKDTSNEVQTESQSISLSDAALTNALFPAPASDYHHSSMTHMQDDTLSLMKTNDTIETLDELLDVDSQDQDAKCIMCLKPGTFIAGSVDTLLQCNSCDDVAIHYTCMKQFALTWKCALCV